MVEWLDSVEDKAPFLSILVLGEIRKGIDRLSAFRPINAIDGLVAVTALVHGMTFVTRNVPHVEHTGVRLLNPFVGS